MRLFERLAVSESRAERHGPLDARRGARQREPRRRAELAAVSNRAAAGARELQPECPSRTRACARGALRERLALAHDPGAAAARVRRTAARADVPASQHGAALLVSRDVDGARAAAA